MHVALFSPAWPLESSHNGIVTFVHWMRLEFERLGHRVSVFTGQFESATNDPRVHVVKAGTLSRARGKLARSLGRPGASVWDWGAVLAESILRVHRVEPIDVIEMEESFGWSADVASMTGIPVLVKLHGPAFLSLVEEELASDFGQQRVEREGRALSAARSIASPSLDTLRQTLDFYHLQPHLAEHLVNPLDLDASVPLWRLEESDSQTLLFVGRFDRRKGADLVLCAFERLARERPELRLVFVGPDNGLLARGREPSPLRRLLRVVDDARGALASRLSGTHAQR